MSDFTDKIKKEAKNASAIIDQELTVLEGVDGIDPLADPDEESAENEQATAEDSLSETSEDAQPS